MNFAHEIHLPLLILFIQGSAGLSQLVSRNKMYLLLFIHFFFFEANQLNCGRNAANWRFSRSCRASKSKQTGMILVKKA